MLGLAAVCAGLAASSVDRYTDDVAAQVGPLRSVVVARADLRRGTLVTAAVARTALELRRVPRRFVPPRSLGAPRQAIGFRTLSTLSAGDYVGEAQLGTAASPRRGHPLQGGRLVEVAVTGAQTIGDALDPGAVVDVLVTTDGNSGRPRTYLALQRIPLVDFRDTAAAGSREGADATATLRTTLRQAATLIAAENFAREVRVLPRARGDMRRLGPTSVSAAALGP
jgi:pilus assembly protein CpaB